MNFKSLAFALAALPMLASPSMGQSSFKQNAYELTPALTYKNVKHDPEGIWKDQDFSGQNIAISLYVKHLEIGAGELVASLITNGACGLNSDCPFQLVLKKADGSDKLIVSGELGTGQSLYVAKDFSSVTAETYDGPVTLPIPPAARP